jgi:glycosyltransferase involved in cell wall biosynthesis
MEGATFVITSLQTWEMGMGTTIRNFTLELSKKNRVIYINTPLDHATWLRNKLNHREDYRLDVIRKKTSPLRKINENLWVLDFPFMASSINKIPSPFLFDYFNRINNKHIGKYIKEQLHNLGINDFLLFIDTDIYRSFYLKELLKPRLSIYYRRDYIIGVSYWKKHGSRLEPLLAAKSDLVLCNSRLFCEELKKYNTEVYLLETGVNLDLYNAEKVYQIPIDIKDIPHPIIGYVGSIFSLRLDENLLCALAEKRQNYSFLFIGPEDEVFKQSKLHKMENVYFTGTRPMSELPAYVSAFDVCINPQKVNEITIGNYPLKIDEYLALGKPVVATETPIMKDVFKDQVHLAKNTEEYLTLLDLGVKESNDPDLKKTRICFAMTHSWKNRVNILYDILSSRFFR